MRFATVPAFLAAALFSVAAAIPFLPAAKKGQGFVVEVPLAASVAGNVRIYFDDGHGYSESATSGAPFGEPNTLNVYRLALPPGRYVALRFDPIDGPGTVTLAAPLRIVSGSGRIVRTIAFAELASTNQIASRSEEAGRLRLTTETAANDPQLEARFAPPLELKLAAREWFAGLLPRAAGVLAGLALLLLALEFSPRLRGACASVGRTLRARPHLAIAIIAAVATLASAYPVVFLGKSYVSPNFGTTLLYDTFPTLPGYHSRFVPDVKGSDVGAIGWQHVPYSFIQHRALSHGELPLWNGYNSAGTPLLGQGQSMAGDPLQFLVVLCGGAAWAWDLKYLVAKWLFACALGLTALAVLAPRPKDQGTKRPKDPGASAGVGPFVFWSLGPLVSALIVSAAAPFVGFFVYRANHPAIFSLCYAPWVLYCWVRIMQAGARRPAAAWIAGLMLANFALMNSGTAKEAYMLLAQMNLGGALVLLLSRAPARERVVKFAAVAWAGGLFALISAPVWATFLHTLRESYTSYNAASAFQIQPALLLGAFDELFYRPLSHDEIVFNPSLNFVLLLGLLYFLATLRLQIPNRPLLAIAAASVVSLALAFGLVPAAWIIQVPFLANVAHIDNCFTLGLIIFWSVLAAAGFAAAAERLATREGRTDLAIAGLLLGALVFAWIAFRQVAHRAVFGGDTTFSVLPAGRVIPVSGFVWTMLVILLAASATLAWIARRALARRALGPGGVILAALCGGAMLWRTALHAEAVGFEDYVLRPPVRVNFAAKSPAVETMRAADARDPARVFGLHSNLMPGWTGVYGLESIHGPDALMNPWYRELLDAAPVERIWDWRIHLEPAQVGKSRAFLDALNVRFYADLHSDRGEGVPPLRLVQAADLDVYESPTAWPRAFFTDRVAVYEQAGDLVKMITAGSGQPFAAVQRSELDSGEARATHLAALPRALEPRAVVAAKNFARTENTTAFDVHATAPGIVVLTEAWLPGDFRAQVNGQRVPILRVNHAFKGVVVDRAGDYRILFWYQPRGLWHSELMAAAGALLLALSWLAAVWPWRRRHDQPAVA